MEFEDEKEVLMPEDQGSPLLKATEEEDTPRLITESKKDQQ